MKWIVCMAVAGCMGAAAAQEMDMTPPAEMKEMAWLLGDWKGEMTFTFGEQPVKSTSKAKTTMGVGGRYVVSHQTYDMMGSAMGGLLLLTYDTEKKKWAFWWYDQMSAFPLEFTGDFTNGKLVGTSKPAPMPGMGELVYRATYEKRSDGKVGFVLETQTGDSWVTLIEGAYEKENK